jgi:hypothetical protein
MNFTEFTSRIFSVLISLLIFFGLLILTAFVGPAAISDLASETIFEVVLLYASPAFLLIAFSTIIFLSMLLVCTGIEAIYSSLGLSAVVSNTIRLILLLIVNIAIKITRYTPLKLPRIISNKIAELLPNQIDEEWQAFINEQKYNWKKSGLTDKQIQTKEKMFFIALSWGKIKRWTQLLEIISWLKLR